MDQVVYDFSSNKEKVQIVKNKIMRLLKQVEWRDFIPNFQSQNFTVNQEDIQKATKWIKESRTIYFYTGAGMSAGSGIPTFRGQFGLWKIGQQFLLYVIVAFIICAFILFVTKTRKIYLVLFIVLAIAAIILPFIGAYALSRPLGWEFSPKLSWVIFKLFLFDKVAKAKHNKGHVFMKYLKDANYSVEVITSNVDNLECEVSTKIRQIHGRLDLFYCSKCGANSPKLELSTRKKLPWLNPKCLECGQRYNRPAALLFKDSGPRPKFASTPFPPYFFNNNATFIVIGTSNMVGFGVGCIPDGSKVIEINVTNEPTTKLRNKTSNHVYFQAKQEDVLESIQNCI